MSRRDVVKRLVFVVPVNLDRPTGGNRYDQALVKALGELGIVVDLRTVPGAWPVATARSRARLAMQLAGPDPVLVDGLLACGAPREMGAAAARGVQVHVLVHMPLGLDTGLSEDVASARTALENEALGAASSVLTTSEWTAQYLRAVHGLASMTVAPPGACPAPVAGGSDPPLLLHLAAISPVKNQLTVVDALALVSAEPWTARLTGALDADREYAQAVQARIQQHRLTERVVLTGPLAGEPLSRLWDATTILLVPSRAETWGLAVTEGLARGIPAVVSRGTGGQEALGCTAAGEIPGALADPDSPEDLAAAIRGLLGPGRERARAAALERRQSLPRWLDTAAIVHRALM